MTTYVLGVLFAVIVIMSIFFRLRDSGMKERYATWWFVVAILVALVSFFPGSLEWLSQLLGVKVPLNLAFFLSGVFLLMLSLQYSVDLSRMEEKRRSIVEECAILRTDLEDVRAELEAMKARTDGGKDQAPQG